MLERIRGKAVLCLILTIFWVGLILIHNPHVTSKYATRYFGISHAGGIPVNGGETVEQAFTIKGGGLMRLKLMRKANSCVFASRRVTARSWVSRSSLRIPMKSGTS